MKEQNSFYITTTLPYVNAPLHMGHALEFIRADVIARYKKLLGFDVYFNTGTDEHGLKIFEKAESLNLAPKEFVDKSFEDFKESIKIFGLDQSILHFVRTTDSKHIKAAQEFWKKCDKNGYIYKKNYQTKYCVGCESEKQDHELSEKGECPDHPDRKLEIIDEENYFFKYSEFTDKLKNFYAENKDFVIPDFRFNEIKAFVERGLHDFSISRLKEKMPWGIPVPGDEKHVMYVWFDALVNYISTLGWPFDPAQGKPEENLFEKYWVNGMPTQYCGKDNLRFQSAMWQAMLMAAGVSNSKQIIINGFITADGGVKMSKTLGNVVDPTEIVKEYGTDALRYFLLREVGSFEDSPFTMERFKDAYNSGLANGLGNLTSRIMTMAVNYDVKLSKEELDIKYFSEKKEDLENFNIHKYINWIWECMGRLDEFIQKNEPFKKIKIDEEGAKKDVHYLLHHLYKATLAIEPMLPETSKKIQELIRENKKPEKPLFLRKE
ncbi:methionine--tRNA ligase [Patescibacteria group bacterium]|nr:methionine--tRNA ligase [Patescibacteria group bacterium]MBU1728031.1 methionine--tRNA ligase [Patescibacteria group bacterium]